MHMKNLLNLDSVGWFSKGNILFFKNTSSVNGTIPFYTFYGVNTMSWFKLFKSDNADDDLWDIKIITVFIRPIVIFINMLPRRCLPLICWFGRSVDIACLLNFMTIRNTIPIGIVQIQHNLSTRLLVLSWIALPMNPEMVGSFH